MRDNVRRYYGGIILNAAGVKFWQRAGEAKTFEGKTASTTTTGGEVNTMIPEAWNERGSVRAMRLRQVVSVHAAKGKGRDAERSPVTKVVTDDRSPDDHGSLEVSPTDEPAALGEPLF
jgi:hypothetical protein